MKLSPETKWRVCRLTAAVGMAYALAGCGDAESKANAPKEVALAPASAQAGAENPGAAASAGSVSPPAAAASTTDTPVATLGAVSVSTREIKAMLERLPEPQRQQLAADRAAMDRLLRARLAEKALVAQAQNQGWAERPEVQRLLDAAREEVVLRTYLDSVSEAPDTYPSEAELQAAYDQNKDRLTQPARYRISQIFLAAPYGDEAAVAKARKQAADLAKRAGAPKADFAALAREHSEDATSAARGGDAGFLPLNQIVPELRGLIQGMKEGEVSEPIQLPTGFHIVKLVDVEPPRTPPLVEVQVQLRNALRAQRQEQAARAYLEGLVNAGTVSVDGKALSAALE